MEMSHKTRRYGYRLKQNFREDPFSIIVLYALFFSAIFLIFAFRGLIATMFIKPIGVINPGTHQFNASTSPNDTTSDTAGNQSTLKLQSTGTYTVKSGDTLAGVAADLNLNWEDLAKLNNIESPYSLSVGQELQLP